MERFEEEERRKKKAPQKKTAQAQGMCGKTISRLMRMFSLRDVSTKSSGWTSVERKYDSSEAKSTSITAPATSDTAQSPD